MSSYNKVMLMGNLTRDPEIVSTQTGMSICKIGLAVNRSYKDKEGNKKEEVSFIDVVAFGKQADVIGKYMTKGKPLFVEGRLKMESWDDKDGNKRSKLGVVLEGFQFIGSGQDKDGQPQQAQAPQKGNGFARRNDSEEDVPF